MKKTQRVRSLIKKIEWFPKIEVVIYAALGIKKCSSFPSGEKLIGILESHSYEENRFYSILRKLKLEIKSGFIAVSGWPDYTEFQKKYNVENSCRGDNVQGRFFDIPVCCAETFSAEGDLTDRRLLQEYPYQGASAPEELSWPTEVKEQQEWFESFSHHLVCYRDRVYDYSEMVRREVDLLIKQQKLGEEIRLFFSMYIPCRVDCEAFMAMARNMNEALIGCLSARRYDELLSDYKDKKVYL